MKCLTIFYDALMNSISYQEIILGEKESIQKYLPNSNGKAISYVNDGQKYWLLLDGKNGNFLLFLQGEDASAKSISNDEVHLQTAKYLASL